MTTPTSNRSAMNFDIPPATRSSTSESRSARHLLHQRIREFNTIRAQRESLASNDGHRSPRRPSFQDQTPAPPPTVGRNARSSHRRHRGGSTSDPPTSILMNQLRDARAEADSLLEQPIPRIGSPDVVTREYLGEAEVNRQRKRRKIDHEGRHLGVGMNGFRYGFRGTAAPGPLKMEMVSCDGGLMHTEAGRIGREYGPDNVLRNDKSVYCTNSNAHRCNIIIRHRDEATFTLSKIVIKAPTTGFTSPVQEGLIFITMSLDGLISRTAAYRVRDSSPPRKTTVSRDEENQRPPSRRRDSTSRSIPPPIAHIMPLPFPFDVSDQSPHAPSTSPPTTNTTIITTPPPLVPGFDITTHCDNPSSDEEEPSSAATLADRHRRDILPPPYSNQSSDSEDVEEGIERVLEARALGISPHMLRSELRSRRRLIRLAEPSRIECRVPGSNSKRQLGSDLDGETTTGGEDQQRQHEQQQRQLPQQQQEKPRHPHPRAPQILAPHARFFIEPEKSVVSVKFEPEVTGKFILLKLWAPSRDQNIDIQSIICHGFAGPRSFPGTTML